MKRMARLLDAPTSCQTGSQMGIIVTTGHRVTGGEWRRVESRGRESVVASPLFPVCVKTTVDACALARLS